MAGPFSEQGTTVDSAGNVYRVNATNNMVRVLPGRNPDHGVGTSGSGDIISRSGRRATGPDNRIYVGTSATIESVVHAAGVYLERQFATGPMAGLDVGADGNVFVADSLSDEIRV